MLSNLRFTRLVTPLLLGAACLVLSPALPAHAEAAAAPAADGQKQSGTHHRMSLEERIAKLHDALQLTSAKEAAWAPVAQAIRDGDAEVKAAKAERKSHYPDMSAIDNIVTYHKGTLALADAEDKLLAAFQPLYEQFPDAQKKLADTAIADFVQPHRHKGPFKPKES